MPVSSFGPPKMSGAVGVVAVVSVDEVDIGDWSSVEIEFRGKETL